MRIKSHIESQIQEPEKQVCFRPQLRTDLYLCTFAELKNLSRIITPRRTFRALINYVWQTIIYPQQFHHAPLAILLAS